MLLGNGSPNFMLLKVFCSFSNINYQIKNYWQEQLLWFLLFNITDICRSYPYISSFTVNMYPNITFHTLSRRFSLPVAAPAHGGWTRCGTLAPPTASCASFPGAAAQPSSSSSHSPQTEIAHVCCSVMFYVLSQWNK